MTYGGEQIVDGWIDLYYIHKFVYTILYRRTGLFTEDVCHWSQHVDVQTNGSANLFEVHMPQKTSQTNFNRWLDKWVGWFFFYRHSVFGSTTVGRRNSFSIMDENFTGTSPNSIYSATNLKSVKHIFGTQMHFLELKACFTCHVQIDWIDRDCLKLTMAKLLLQIKFTGMGGNEILHLSDG